MGGASQRGHAFSKGAESLIEGKEEPGKAPEQRSKFSMISFQQCFELTGKDTYRYKIQIEYSNHLDINYIGNEKWTTSLKAADGKIITLYSHGT